MLVWKECFLSSNKTFTITDESTPLSDTTDTGMTSPITDDKDVADGHDHTSISIGTDEDEEEEDQNSVNVSLKIERSRAEMEMELTEVTRLKNEAEAEVRRLNTEIHRLRFLN